MIKAQVDQTDRKQPGRWLVVLLLLLLSFSCLALSFFVPELLAKSREVIPVSLISELKADYSGEPFGQTRVAPVRVSLVEEVVDDQNLATNSIPLEILLQTPVPSVTPVPTTGGGSTSPASATPLPTSTEASAQGATATLPVTATPSMIPTATRTRGPTRTSLPASTNTDVPIPTSTAVPPTNPPPTNPPPTNPSLPTNTITPNPTRTPGPTKTPEPPPTNTPPPAYP